jgi:NADP-dependent 3-hydroxy acid dehydrogenase YdfG
VTDQIRRRSVIITGAGNGFGKLTAGKLAALGARVACLDLNLEAATEVAESIKEAGGEAIAIGADVSSLDEMRRAVATTLAAFGSIDVLVNNAGVMPLSFVAEHESALPAWMRCIDINLKGMIHGCAAVHDQMMTQGRGHIVNVSSIYGNRPTAGAAVYGATKAAVDYFSHALRQEARGRIKVTVVKPTGVLATGLADTVVNKAAGAPIVGHNLAEFYAAYAKLTAGEAGDLTDPDAIANAFLGPEPVADAIVHVINQPWGVSLSDITVRASGDHYVN